jgi:hypothetical protein
VQRAHVEPVPAGLPFRARPGAAGAQLEHRDRLVDPAEQRRLLLEDLHEHARMAVLGLEQRLGVVEVGVGVVARAHLLDGQAEDVGIEPLRYLGASSTRARRAPSNTA